jgi:beta-glucosidase
VSVVPAARRFPDGFLWGCATAAHQVEGDNHNCDWWEFEQRGGILTGDSADPACDQYRRFREDFALLGRLHNNAHRLSIEWSRVEPVQGEFDRAQIEHYREVLTELRTRGMTPMVTLHHFTSPLWFSRRGGWAASGAADAWLPFVRQVAEELGELAGLWCTINEPNIYAYQGWVAGEFPPGRRGDVLGVLRVLGNLRRAHTAACRQLHRLTPGVPVGLAQHRWLMIPSDETRRRDRFAAGAAAFFMDRWPVGGGRWAPVVQAPGDYIGLNHYTGSLVKFSARRIGEGFARRSNPPGLPESDFGWAVRPRWLRDCVEDLRPLGRPIYVTENGIAARDDRVRVEYLRGALGELWEAIQAGADVRGYFHWSSHDNFEWAHGYSMRFGLIGVDLASQERTVKPSGELFARIAAASALPPED